MNDVMLDLETWGTGHNAVIVQVGACYFDRHTGEIGKTLCENIDARESIAAGFEVDAATIYWWMQQSPEAQRSITGDSEYSLVGNMTQLNDFMSKAKCVWSHATFDWVILMNHFKKLGIKPKVHYRAARDLRTLVDLANLKYGNRPRVGTHHNALDDCVFQVGYAVECLNKLKEEK